MEIVNNTDQPVEYVIRSARAVFLESFAAVLEGQIRPLLPAACAGSFITLLARVPGNPEADLCVTPDSYPELAELLRRCEARETGSPGVESVECEVNFATGEFREVEIRDAKLHNLRERLKDCAALARELDLDEAPILRAEAVLTPEPDQE